MKLAKDFRQMARDVLYGKWKLAVLVCLVAVLLGGAGVDGPTIKLEIEDSWAKAVVEFAGVTVGSVGGSSGSDIGSFLINNSKGIVTVSAIIGIIYFLLGSIIELGFTKFHLNLVDQKEAAFENLFEYFDIWKTAIISRVLQFLYMLFWTFLFVIPGIIAAFNYSMTSFILAEHPEMTANEAISRSKEMMYGNRWRLFCLEFSFIGWGILCAFTLGIGQFWLIPYKKAAVTAFYREISGTRIEEEICDAPEIPI